MNEAMSPAIDQQQVYLPWKDGHLVYNMATEKVRFETQVSSKVSNDVQPPLATPDPQRFLPVCLTIFPHNRCNLSCRYCYAATNGPHPKIHKYARLESALELLESIIIPNCRRTGRGPIIGFHGGCEPFLDSKFVVRCVKETTLAIRSANLRPRVYLTTNGVMDSRQARLVAELFDGVTVSCDGPPEIHDHNRLTREGQPTFKKVAATLQILLENMQNPSQIKLRVTITNGSVSQMERIVEYFIKTWPTLRQIHLEPLYCRGRGGDKVDPVLFVQGYIRARKFALRHGLELIYAGSRPGEQHSRFCPVMQSNLSVTPDDYLTGCFCVTERRGEQDDRFLYGHKSSGADAFFLNEERLAGLLQTINLDCSQCQSCFNRKHCSRGCPEICPMEDNFFEQAIVYDCRIQRWIGFFHLLARAGIKLSESDLANIESLFP